MPGPFTVLNVAFPLAPVRPDAVGGAEQILGLIDRGLVQRGHRSIVVASEDSSVAGELVATQRPPQRIGPSVHQTAIEAHKEAIAAGLSRWRVDLVHLHGHDFDAYLPPPGVPVLATIHLPPELLVARLDALHRPATWVHGVSRHQHARLPNVPNLLAPIGNGVPLDELHAPRPRRDFVLALGRICPEKGFHLALDAARAARVPLLLGGKVFGYDDHREYFDAEIRPRLDGDRRYLGPLSTAHRRRLLNAARCVVIPSLAPETSSLVAMEALACGTPVVALRSGALPDTVEHGATGFIVDDVDEMASAIGQIGDIDRDRCRERARSRFSADRMVDEYLARYAWVLAQCGRGAHA